MSLAIYSNEKIRASYFLLMECAKSFILQIPSLGRPRITKGVYLYIGSAAIKEPTRRVFRHFALKKKMKWHIDYLTVRCRPRIAAVLYDVSEDELYEAILKFSFPSYRKLVRLKIAVKSFGSTDKPYHKSHLFKVINHVNFPDLYKLTMKILSSLEGLLPIKKGILVEVLLP